MPKIKPKAHAEKLVRVTPDLLIGVESFRNQKAALIRAVQTSALLSSEQAREDVDHLGGVMGMWDAIGDAILEAHPDLKAEDVFPIPMEDLRQ